MENINPGMKEAAASEPNPISKRRPLTAITAVHALCNRINMKLVRPMSQEPCLRPSLAGAPVCLVTILLSSRDFVCPPVDALGYREVTAQSQFRILVVRRSSFRASMLRIESPWSGREFFRPGE